jgi:hypothetical protein
LGALAGKTADTVTRAEINATTAGAGYNETTDSQEALRDRGDLSWITAAGFATSSQASSILTAVGAPLQSVSYVAPDNTSIAALKIVVDKYATMIVLDGAVYQFTINALENGPSGGGGGSSTIIVAPLTATVPVSTIAASGTTQAFRYCALPAGPIAITQADGTPFVLTGGTLISYCVDVSHPELSFNLLSTAGALVIGGTDGNQITFVYTPVVAGTYQRNTYFKPVSGSWQKIEFGFWEIEDGPNPALLT